MKSFLIVTILFITPLLADKTAMLIQKGARISKVMCDKNKLQSLLAKTTEEAKKRIVSEKICSGLNPGQLEAVALFVTSSGQQTTTQSIHVPKDAKCPICGMFVAKYPKWVAFLKDSQGHKYYFDGVKDMMKYYFNHKNETFPTILVQDFYTLKPIEAKKAFYVIGANIYGPMGRELIPFKTREDAQTFKTEHYGKKIIRFNEIEEEYLYEE